MSVEYLFSFMTLAILCHLPEVAKDSMPVAPSFTPTASTPSPDTPRIEMFASIENICFSVFNTYDTIDDKKSILHMNKRIIISMHGRIINRLSKTR